MELAHVRRGTGEPLVLIHGLGSRRQVWDPVLVAVARHREVLALDLPGFGGTPPGDTEPSMDGLTTAVETFLAEHDLHRPHVAGSSLGAGIALELGRRGVARSVTAFSPIGFWGTAGRHWAYAALTGSRALAEWLPAPLTARLAGSRAARTAALSLFFGRPWLLDPRTVLADMAGLTGAPYFTPVRQSLADHVFAGPDTALDAIPVTIAWGTRDVLLPYRTQSRVARALMPSARHVVLPGCGHLPFADDPRLCAQVLLDGSRPDQEPA
jgi:pimeloyl-ACP methyl ester carboxylesterase